MFLLISTLAVGTLLIVSIRWYLNISQRLTDVPGPPVPSFIVGNVLELEQAPMGTLLLRWAKQYGQTFKIAGPLYQPWLILSDPIGVNHVLQGKNYIRPAADRQVLELFLKQQYEALLETSSDGVIDIAPNIHMLAEISFVIRLDAISMTMFMHNISASEGRIPSLLHEITNSPTGDYFTVVAETLASLFPSILLLPNPLKSYTDNLRKEFTVIAEEVWSGKHGAGMHAKVLDALGPDHYKAKDKTADGSPISKEEAIAQIIGVMFAGSETTANVVVECLYELAKHPSIQTRLREEFHSFQAQSGHFPTYEELMNGSSLPYFEAVIRETLRTKAVLREIGRMAVEDDVIPLHFPLPSGRKQVSVKAGEIIQVSIRDGVNSDPEIWGSDASEFRPDRWLIEDKLPEVVKALRAQGHLYTFGDGSKVCLGRTFDNGYQFDFYHLGGNTIKPKIRGRESEGVQLLLKVAPLS
ncbi:hypothetical protein Clacol_002642 [Clathrus columnatus]|uniref:Cytochrome P450 n=1 Tax=Clathrus columnatus TaxID=1419009 RepID=A0AAV5A5Z5_9AGAM|nr:hypothetical protein Clacol_002642 [Clathrus columnatus]